MDHDQVCPVVPGRAVGARTCLRCFPMDGEKGIHRIWSRWRKDPDTSRPAVMLEFGFALDRGAVGDPSPTCDAADPCPASLFPTANARVNRRNGTYREKATAISFFLRARGIPRRGPLGVIGMPSRGLDRCRNRENCNCRPWHWHRVARHKAAFFAERNTVYTARLRSAVSGACT